MMKRLARPAAALALAATAMLGGCLSTDADAEPNIANMHISSGASSVTVPVTGTQSAPLVLQAGQLNTITIRFLDPTGTVDPVIAEHSSDFTLQVTPPSGWVYSANSSAGGVFIGTLAGVTAGTHSMTVALEHDGHSEFSRSVQIQVAP